MTAELWAGLDVGVYRTSVCITNDDGTVVQEADSATEPAAIEAILAQHPGIVSIAMESGAGNHLVRMLRKVDLPVVMFDAFKASRFLAIRRNKTDKNDARGLADLARLGRDSVSVVHLKGEECRAIRFKLGLRAGIINQRKAAENLLRTLLREHGKAIPSAFTVPAFRAAIDSVLNGSDLDAHSRKAVEDLTPLLDLCESVRAYNRVLNNQLRSVAKKNETCRRLMTIPGVGPICALSFYSTVEDPWRFRRVANVGAYLGLAPKVRETGGKAGRARISKAGDSMTRANLFMAAKVLLSTGYRDCDLAAWAITLRERLGAKRAKVALARKLAIVMAAVWKSGGDFVAFGHQLPREASPGTPLSS